MTHKSHIIEVRNPVSGVLVVIVRCCDDSKSDSGLTLNQLDRGHEQIDADIAAHQAKVESLHASTLAALEHVQRLAVAAPDAEYKGCCS